MLAPANVLGPNQFWVYRSRLMDWIFTMAVKIPKKKPLQPQESALSLGRSEVFSTTVSPKLVFCMCIFDDQWGPKLTKAVKLVNILRCSQKFLYSGLYKHIIKL